MRYIKVLQDGIGRIDSSSDVAGLFTSNLEDCIAIVLIGENKKISMIHKTFAMNLQEILDEARWIDSNFSCCIIYNDAYHCKPGSVEPMQLLIKLCGTIKSQLSELAYTVKFSTKKGHCVFVDKDTGKLTENCVPTAVQLPPFANVRDTVNFLNNIFSPGNARADRLFMVKDWTALPALVPCGEEIVTACAQGLQVEEIPLLSISMQLSDLYKASGTRNPFFDFLRHNPETVNTQLGRTANILARALSNIEFKLYLEKKLLLPVNLDKNSVLKRLNDLLPIPLVVYSDSREVAKAIACFNNPDDIKLITDALDAINIRYESPKIETNFIDNAPPVYTLQIQIGETFIEELDHAEAEKSRRTLKM